MTTQKEFLQTLVNALKRANIPYMLSGSVSSSFHGQPRATNDVDIVIDPAEEQLLDFVNLLGPDYYSSKDAALQALKDKAMFNIIETKAGWKADFIVRKNRPYSRREFDRRKSAVVMEIDLCVLSAEDSILSKLEWSKGRESQAQFKDALGVLMVQWDRLDFDYLAKWAKELKVEDSLEQLLKEIRKTKS